MHCMNLHEQSRHRADGRSGFTLVELVVVVAVIAILACVLLPVMARTRSGSALVACLNNQKQYADAALMFSADHADYLVSAGQINSTNDSVYSWRIEPQYAF